MAEQTIERHAPSRASRTSASAARTMPAHQSRDALRDAKSYLESADRRLRRDGAQADEVLRLLRLAGEALERALNPESGSYGLSGAE
jgi:hypothetical protein